MKRFRLLSPLSLLLIAVIASGGAFGAAQWAYAQQSSTSPWPVPNGYTLDPPERQGWVKASAIGGGCTQNGRRTDCTSRIVGNPPNLYEKPSLRRPAPGCESIGCGPADPGDAPVRVERHQCTVDGVFLRWPAGTWHYGGYFSSEYQTRKVIDDATGITITQSRTIWSGPSNTHRAFWHADSCEPSEAWVIRQTAIHSSPTPPPPPPPGTTATPTPTTPPTPTVGTSPTPTTPSPSPCYPDPIPPMPLTLSEGTIPFDGSNLNPDFISYPDRYIGAVPNQYYRNNTHDAYVSEGQARAMYNQLPDRNLWVRVNANRIVAATFGLMQTSFRPPGHAVNWGVFEHSAIMNSRALMIVLQDLGNDQRPGGGDDRLMAFIAAGDSPVNANGMPPQHLKVAGSYRDVFGRVGDYQDHPQIEGRPTGFQAYLQPGVLPDFTGRIFSWLGNDAAPHVAARWPVPRIYDANGSLSVHAREWFWPPHGSRDPTRGTPSDLQLRFATEPNRVYRMFALIESPVCINMYTAVSQLVFHTMEEADMRILKDAPAEAVRETQISYSLTALNIGSAEARDVVVTDALPEGTTFVSADPPPTSVDGRTLRWELGSVPPQQSRSFSIVAAVQTSAPDTIVNVGEVQASNDNNPANNRAEATTNLVRTNVGVRMTATRMVRPGDALEVRITYRNTSGTTARNVLLTYNVPFGAVVTSSSLAASGSAPPNGMVWNLGDLAAGAGGTITLNLRALREDETTVLPAVLEHLAVIQAVQDADPTDNMARAATAVLVFPRPAGDLRMRIYSEFDRQQQVYRTESAAFAWPIGETLYFIPDVTLREPPTMSPPAYAARQRVVAWSFVGSGSLTLTGAGCKAREMPPAAETEHADLSRMQGCVYRYRTTVGPTEMLAQGRLYWAAFAPESLSGATYGLWPLPPSPTNIRIQYAVLTELVETGMYDLDGDGRSDSILDRRTDVLNGTYSVTLVAPRDAR